MLCDRRRVPPCTGQKNSHPPAATYPQFSLPNDVKNDAVAAEWIVSFRQFLQNKDICPPKDIFFGESYWRDHLCLLWDFHTWHGPDEISCFLRHQQKGCRIRQVSIDVSDSAKKPKLVPIDHNGNFHGIQVYMKLETDVGTGKGLVRLLHEVESQKWKAFTLYTAFYELRSHEETVRHRRHPGFDYRLPEASTKFRNWREMRIAQENFQASLEPTVLIIGAGQAGLASDARLTQLGISCLIIDQNQRVGDCWRNRYLRLVLHDPVWYNHMPYLPFPENWPVFAPKDKLAEWMESYAQLMELNVWLSTKLQQAKWDGNKWKVTLERHFQNGGAEVQIVRPHHIIQATGVSGEPNVPEIEGINNFQGFRLCHSSQFSSAQSTTTAKRIVVVGSGVSGHDIAQDFHEHGHEVTMIQRSATCVDTSDYIQGQGLYSEDGPATEPADFITHSVSLALLKSREIEKTEKLELENYEFFEGLRKAGFGVDKGPDGAGRKFKFLEHAGGSYIDVGASQLIIDGHIKVKQGRVARIKAHALLLDDGTEVPADEIIFATGYTSMLETTKKILGAEFADQLKEVWGVDEEGELKSVWRHSGHPGFWFAGGNLALCRYYSRLLALQIKAIEEDIMR